MQPCEVSKKISIFSCRWKSAPEAMTACWMFSVVWRQDPLVRLLFMLWDRPRGDEIDNEAFELTKQMFDHHGDTRLNEESNRLCKQNTDLRSHSVCSETRDQYACVMGDILQLRKLGTSWKPELEDSSVKVPSVSKLWRPPPHYFAHGMVQHSVSRSKVVVSNTRKRTCRACCLELVAAFAREGLSADVRRHWSLLASLLPRGIVIRDTRWEMT